MRDALNRRFDVVLAESLDRFSRDEGALPIELRGNLAAMLSAATNAKRSPETGDLSLQVQTVAGGPKATRRRRRRGCRKETFKSRPRDQNEKGGS